MVKDPFQALAHGLRPELDMDDRVEQLYIQFTQTPNPPMMLYFYENFESYWQCACGSQNEHDQKFCGHCGVRHDWLSAHCSDYVLAARLIARKGPDAVRWYNEQGVRVQSPWIDRVPLALMPDQVDATWAKGVRAQSADAFDDAMAPPLTLPASSYVATAEARRDMDADTAYQPKDPVTPEMAGGPLEATRMIPIIREPDRLFDETDSAVVKYQRPDEDVSEEVPDDTEQEVAEAWRDRLHDYQNTPEVESVDEPARLSDKDFEEGGSYAVHTSYARPRKEDRNAKLAQSSDRTVNPERDTVGNEAASEGILVEKSKKAKDYTNVIATLIAALLLLILLLYMMRPGEARDDQAIPTVPTQTTQISTADRP